MIVNAPHAWELIVKDILRSLTFWAVVGVFTLFRPIEQPGLGMFDSVNAIPSPRNVNDVRRTKVYLLSASICRVSCLVRRPWVTLFRLDADRWSVM